MTNHRRSAGTGRAKLTVRYLGKAKQEAREFLNEGQCLELEDVVDRLEDFDRKRELWDLDITHEGELGKLVHTGTSLSGIVAEVYFGHIPEWNLIVVLGVREQGNEPQEKWYRRERMRTRLAHFRRIQK